MEGESYVFKWNEEEISTFVYGKLMVEETIEGIKLAHRAKLELGRQPKILEAGSGNGCVVILFNRLGFDGIKGVEINNDIVKVLHKKYPEYSFTHGSITNLPPELKNNDVVLSLGVVEHFIDGLDKPIKAMFDATRPGGYALISVPCLNTTRKFKKLYQQIFHKGVAEEKRKYEEKNHMKFKYWPRFLDGDFFEYHLSTKQFRKELEKAGFEVLSHVAGEDELGLREAFNRKNKRKLIWEEPKAIEFFKSRGGGYLLRFAKAFPFFASHFQICICRRPVE